MRIYSLQVERMLVVKLKRLLDIAAWLNKNNIAAGGGEGIELLGERKGIGIVHNCSEWTGNWEGILNFEAGILFVKK